MYLSRFALILAAVVVLPLRAMGVEHFVSIPGFEFSPAEITVDVGDIVTWTNNHTFTHTSTSDDGGIEWDSGFLLPGQSFSHTFNSAGAFPYLCSIHPVMMRGTVTVVGGGSDCGNYVVGDFNGSGTFNISDIVDAFSRLKTGMPAPALVCECPAGSGDFWAVAMDVNNSCAFNVSDVITGFSRLKTGSPVLLPCDACPPGGRL